MDSTPSKGNLPARRLQAAYDLARAREREDRIRVDLEPLRPRLDEQQAVG